MNYISKRFQTEIVKILIIAILVRMKTVMIIDTKKSEMLKLINKSFFHTILLFTKTENTKWIDTCKRSIIILAIHTTHLKCDFVDRKIVSRNRQPVLYSFALGKTPRQRRNKRKNARKTL